MHTSIVARQPELEYLHSCLRRVERSQSIGVLVSGQAGIGKTTLLREFARSTVSQGFIVCRCFLGDQGPTSPFEMWRLAIREWILQAEAKGETSVVRQLVGRPWQTLSGLAPDLFARYGWLSSTLETRRSDPRIDSVERQLGEEIMLFIAAATRRLPTVLLVDNLHSADRDSMGSLGEISPDVSALPAMFLATFRPDRIDAGSPSDTLIKALTGPGDMPVMQLGALSVYGVQQYLSHNNMAHDIGTASALHSATGGHPLLLSELKPRQSAGELPSLLGTSAIDSHTGAAVGTLSSDLLQALDTILDRRLRRLDDTQRKLLGSAALLGEDLTVRALVSCTGHSRSSVVHTLDAAVQLNIVAQRGGPEGKFHFRHSLLRETIARRVPAEDQQTAHMQIADYLFSLIENPGVAAMQRISDHYFRAGNDRGIRKGIQLALAAARAALRIGAWREAMHILNGIEHDRLVRISDTQGCELDIAWGIVLLYLKRKPEAYSRVVHAVTRIAEGTDIGDASELLLRPEIADLYGPEYARLLRTVLPAITRSHWLNTDEQIKPADRQASSVLRKLERLARFQKLEDVAENARSLRGKVAELSQYSESPPARDHSEQSRASELHSRTEIRTRHAIAELYRVLYFNPRNTQTIRQLSQHALSLARETRNSFLIAEVFLSRFEIELRALNVQEARKSCDAGLEAYPVHDPLLFGRVHLESLCGETEIALQYLERLKANGGAHEDGPTASLITRAGALHVMNIFTPESGIRGEQALGILKRLTRRRKLSEDLQNQVNTLNFIIGAYAGTVDTPSTAYELSLYLEPSPLVSIGHVERVRMLSAGLVGDHDRVASHHELAMKWFERLDDNNAPILTMVECADMMLGGHRVAGTGIIPNRDSRSAAHNLLRSAYARAEKRSLPALRSMVRKAIRDWDVYVPEMRTTRARDSLRGAGSTQQQRRT